jgi:hypothetical protein
LVPGVGEEFGLGLAADELSLSSVIAKGNVFAPLQDGHYFAANMHVADDRLGIEWPNRVDFSRMVCGSGRFRKTKK